MSRVLSCVVLIAVLLMIGCEGPPIVGIAESAVVGATVSTDATSYAPNSEIDVSWAGLPGNDHDWVGYAPAGSPPTEVTRWAYAGGRTTGVAAFQGTAAGTYVARAFLDDSYTKLAESAPFTVGTVVPPPARTINVPVMGPSRGSIGTLLLAPRISGTGTLIIPLPLGGSDVFRGLRARIFTEPMGAMAAAKLMISTDNDLQYRTLASTLPSSGLGTEETISISNTTTPIPSNSQFFVEFHNENGGPLTTATIYRLEVDVD